MGNIYTRNVNGVLTTGVPQLGSVVNGDIAHVFNILYVLGQDAKALSTSNPMWVTVPSTSAGQTITLPITANQSLNDGGHGTPQILGRWGTTASVAWNSPMPVFVGLANKDNTAANLRFFLTRNPCMTTTPSSTNNIGIGGSAPATSDQGNIVLFGTAANTGYNSKPCIILGSLQATIDSSAGGVMTIQTLQAGRDGFGFFQNNRQFSFPEGQNGATSGSFFSESGSSTTLDFSSMTYLYSIDRRGWCTSLFSTGTRSAADSSSIPIRIHMPYVSQQACFWKGLIILNGGLEKEVILEIPSSQNYYTLGELNSADITVGAFSDTNDSIRSHVIQYPVYANT